MYSLLPPLDAPLSLNPTAPPPAPHPFLPLSLLVDYVGPLSPVSWSRPASPTLASSALPHMHDHHPLHRRPRSNSRLLRFRSRPTALAHPVATPTSSPVPTPPSSPYRDAAPPPSLAPSMRLPTADDSTKVVKVIASHGRTGDQCELSYFSSKVVGNGSFGVVFQAKLVPGSLGPDNEGDDDVAIKKVLQDKRFKVRPHPPLPRSSDGKLTSRDAPQNRELQIMRLVKHPNVVNLRAFFYSNGDKVRPLVPRRRRASAH